METYKLRNGAVVLAKTGKFGLNPVSYTNYKQANAKLEMLKEDGIEASIYSTGVCKYILISKNESK